MKTGEVIKSESGEGEKHKGGRRVCRRTEVRFSKVAEGEGGPDRYSKTSWKEKRVKGD